MTVAPPFKDPPVLAQTLDDLEHEVERVLADPGALGHVRAQTHSCEDRLDRVTRAQVEPVLGREVVEGDEVVPVAVERLGCGVLASLVEPAGQLVAGRLAEPRSQRRQEALGMTLGLERGHSGA